MTLACAQDEFWKVRFAAVQTVGKFGRDAKAAVPTLVRVLKDGSVKRPEVAITLSCLGKKGLCFALPFPKSHVWGCVRVFAGLVLMPSSRCGQVYWP